MDPECTPSATFIVDPQYASVLAMLGDSEGAGRIYDVTVQTWS
jgi:hypothetical protein